MMRRNYLLNILFGVLVVGITILIAVATLSALWKTYGISIKKEASVGDYLTSIGLLVGAVGLFFTWYQLRYNAMQKRAEIAIGFLKEYLKDSDMSKMFYDLEYGRFEYNEDTFNRSDVEVRLDKLLAHFEQASRLVDLGILKMDDLLLIRYEFVQVYKNEQVQLYLKRLETNYPDVKKYGGNFPRFQILAEELAKLNQRPTLLKHEFPTLETPRLRLREIDLSDTSSVRHNLCEKIIAIWQKIWG